MRFIKLHPNCKCVLRDDIWELDADPCEECIRVSELWNSNELSKYQIYKIENKMWSK